MPLVTQRPLFICLFLLSLLFGLGGVAHAADIVIKDMQLEAVEDGYRLAASYEFELNHTLEETIAHGVPLYFTTELELTRPRWYWLDEKAISAKQTVRISYNVLTRKYNVATLDSVQQTFNTLDDALFLLRRPNRWLVAGKGALKGGEIYHGTLRMRLNLEYQPKPIQVDVINKSDWRLSSDKKSFTYKAEEK